MSTFFKSPYSDGPFTPVLFATTLEGLRTYTYRSRSVALAHSLVHTLVVVRDEREFNQRFIDTEFLRR